MSQSQLVDAPLHRDTTDEQHEALSATPKKTTIAVILSRRYQMRRIRSRGALLVLIWIFLVYSACTITYFVSIDTFNAVPILKKCLVSAVFILTITCPFAGWLADVYFGRYRVMRAGLWLMWIGSFIVAVTLIIQYNLCHSGSRNIILDIGLTLAAITLSIGFVCFLVTSLQFGTDQMTDASGEQISAFIQWYIWSMFAGYEVANISDFLNCARSSTSCSKLRTYQALVPCILLSLALCCNFLFKNWLIIEPHGQNPLKTVVGVLKFASRHKRPVMRSAFTYCGEAKPCRIDLAKTRYGGPFTTEEVEDVKTCLRMQVVIMSTAAFFIPGFLTLMSRRFFLGQFLNSGKGLCFESDLYSGATFGMLIIPVCEFVVYPLFRNRIPSMVKRLAIGLFFSIALNVVLIATDTAGSLSSHHVECMFSLSNSTETIHIDNRWVGIPINLLVAAQICIVFTALFEFTCAQAPYSMRGLLIGLVYSLQFSMFAVSYSIIAAWREAWKKQPSSKPSCDFWFFLSQVLLGVFGFVLLLVVAKWYKNRQREEPCRDRQFVEDYYERYCVERTHTP